MIPVREIPPTLFVGSESFDNGDSCTGCTSSPNPRLSEQAALGMMNVGDVRGGLGPEQVIKKVHRTTANTTARLWDTSNQYPRGRNLVQSGRHGGTTPEAGEERGRADRMRRWSHCVRLQLRESVGEGRRRRDMGTRLTWALMSPSVTAARSYSRSNCLLGRWTVFECYVMNTKRNGTRQLLRRLSCQRKTA